MPTIEPVYQKIVRHIEEEIRAGKYRAGDKLPTEAAYASQFCTSRTTVVKALDQLAARKRIYRVRGSGSFVNHAGEALARARILSLIVPYGSHASIQHRNEYQLIQGCEQYASSQGYFVTVSFTGNDLQEEKRVVRACKQELSQGIILSPALAERELSEFLDLVLGDFPTILIDSPYIVPSCRYVFSDNMRGGYSAAQHLLECGYDTLLFVGDSLTHMHQSVQERYVGFCSALRDAGQSVETGRLVALAGSERAEYMEAESAEVLRQLLAAGSGRIGVLCWSDTCAIGLLRAALASGLRVPEALGIVGFDNSLLLSPIPLSTVNQDYFGIGQTACRRLIDTIRTGNRQPGIEHLPTELIARGTTAKL